MNLLIIKNVITTAIWKQIDLFVLDSLIFDEVSILCIDEAPPAIDSKVGGDFFPSFSDKICGVE